MLRLLLRVCHILTRSVTFLPPFTVVTFGTVLVDRITFSGVYTCEHFVREPVLKHSVRVISTGFANRSQTVRCAQSPVGFFEKHKGCSQLSGYRVHPNFRSPPCLQEDFPISPTIFTVGSSFSTGSPEVRGKINFPNMFASVYAALCIQKLNTLSF